MGAQQTLGGPAICGAGGSVRAGRAARALPRRWAHVWRGAALGALLAAVGPAVAAQPITGSVEMDGGTVGSGQGPRDHSNDYTGKYKITVAYTVATKVVNGKKVFDPENSKVTITDSKYKWTTEEIPLKDVQGDPTKGTVTGFTLDGPKWYKDAESDGVVDKGIKGTVTFDPKNKGKAKGTITAKYEDDTGKTKSNYTFTTDAQKPGKPKGGAKPLSTEIDESHSVDFDAAAGTLSIHDDVVVDTPTPGDPLLGASLGFPDFAFAGLSEALNVAVFWAQGDTPMTMALGADVFQRSAMPLLFYDLDANLFYARLGATALAGMASASPFFDPGLATTSSAFLDGVAHVLDPASAGYDASAGFFLTITPTVDFGMLTKEFAVSAHTGAVDAHFVSSVPEPVPVSLVAVGVALVLGAMRVRRLDRSGTVR
jgi:hypothetical protein